MNKKVTTGEHFNQKEIKVSDMRLTILENTSLAAKGVARSPPATPNRLRNPKWLPGGPKMADGVWKGVYP